MRPKQDLEQEENKQKEDDDMSAVSPHKPDSVQDDLVESDNKDLFDGQQESALPKASLQPGNAGKQ